MCYHSDVILLENFGNFPVYEIENGIVVAFDFEKNSWPIII